MNTNTTKAAIAIALLLGIGGVVDFSGMLSPNRVQATAFGELAGEDETFPSNSQATRTPRAETQRKYTELKNHGVGAGYPSNEENYPSGDNSSNVQQNQTTSIAR